MVMSRHRSQYFHVLAVAILLLPGAAGCGSSPAAPTSRILPGPGAYWLGMAGYSVAFDPEVPPCIQESGSVLLSVVVRVNVSFDRGVSVGRTPSEIGNLELRIRGDEEVTDGIEVRGFIVGTAVDTTSVLPRRAFLPVPDVTIRLAGSPGSAASIKGLAERTDSQITGTMSGDIRFSNSLGWVSRCTTITWSLLPVHATVSGPA